MHGFRGVLALAFSLAVSATIIDRIAVVVNDHIVKDSDIARDIRLVGFMNGQAPKLDAATRKEAANRLIDQQFIRREISMGEYPQPTSAQVNEMLAQFMKGRFSTDQQFEKTLAADGITAPELKRYLHWQLTVLQFIDVRFRPAVLVTDDDIKAYYDKHLTELTREHPNQPHTLEALTEEIRQTIAGERVNEQFYAWLAARRKNAKIEYHEEGLQ